MEEEEEEEEERGLSLIIHKRRAAKEPSTGCCRKTAHAIRRWGTHTQPSHLLLPSLTSHTHTHTPRRKKKKKKKNLLCVCVCWRRREENRRLEMATHCPFSFLYKREKNKVGGSPGAMRWGGDWHGLFLGTPLILVRRREKTCAPFVSLVFL